MKKASDYYCESIPWGCDFGTNIYEVTKGSAKDENYYVLFKRSTFMCEVRHGSKDTGMSPKPKEDDVGDTTMTFYVKNLKTGLSVVYRDWDISGDLECIKWLQKDFFVEINEETYAVGDVSSSCHYCVSDGEDEENYNTGKSPVRLEDLISVTKQDFIDIYVHDAVSADILKHKFVDQSWTKLTKLTCGIRYNEDNVVRGSDETPQQEWYDLFLFQRSNSDCHPHLRIPVELGKWFKLPLTTTNKSWSYKETKDYEFYCMDCGAPCRERHGLTGNELEAWFTKDDEFKVCPDCDQ